MIPLLLFLAWCGSTILSIVFSPAPSIALAREAWTWPAWHKNDLAAVPILIALLPTANLPLGGLLVAVSNSRNAIVGWLVIAWARAWSGWRCALLAGTVTVAGTCFTLDPYFLERGVARLGHWLVALRMWKHAVLVGQGPFLFTDFYLLWLPERLPFGIVPEVRIIPWAHNLYLEVLAERGLVGFAIFAACIAWTFAKGTPRVRQAMAAFCAMAVFDLTFLKPWCALAFWVLVGSTAVSR